MSCLAARDNGSGVLAFDQSNLEIRNSRLTKNKVYGHAGIFLCNSNATASQVAEGDQWSPTPTGAGCVGESEVPSCETIPTPYVEVAYKKATNGGHDPLAEPSACNVGP